MKKTVVELFAGVGGFRVGLNNVKLNSSGSTIENGNFDFVWINQWEPSTKLQHAFECYESRFGCSPNHSNQDITTVRKTDIPDHSLLVGGFPCQDYSVARSLSKEQGIEGRKGVLWWEINEILKVKRPPFVLLENVDRLLKSPSKQRGRDFGIMLSCFDNLGYGVEWRVINAADYGHPQKRRRVYIFAYHKNTSYYKYTKNIPIDKYIKELGLFAQSFPVEIHNNQTIKSISLSTYTDLLSISNSFAFDFKNSGFIREGNIYSSQTSPVLFPQYKLRNLIEKSEISETYYINSSYDKFKYLKGAKKIPRQRNGVNYNYSEGSMSFPDSLDSPGRTMLTSEGSINRSTHVIMDPITQRLRKITPVEAERMNEFPDNWTIGMPEKRRFFMMGNALVCGVISKIGEKISKIIDKEN